MMYTHLGQSALNPQTTHTHTHTHNVIHIIYQINKHTFTNKIPKLTTYLWWADKLRGPASNTKHHSRYRYVRPICNKYAYQF